MEQRLLYLQQLEHSRAYWRDYLKDYNTVCRLLGTTKETAEECIPPQRAFRLPTPIQEAMEKRCRELEITERTFIQTAWGILVGRYNGMEDVVFGTADAFHNIVPLRIKPMGKTTAASLLQAVQQDNQDSNKHYYMQLADVLLESELGQHLFEQVLVFWETASSPEATVEDTYDFLVNVIPGETLEIRFEGKAKVYNEDDLARFERHFLDVVNWMLSDSNAPLEEMDYLGTAGAEEVLGFNPPTIPRQTDATLVSLFKESVNRCGDLDAVVSGDKRLSYRELDECSDRLAHYLRATYGIGTEDFVGIMLDRSEWFIIAVLGILKAGGAYVPFDPDYPRSRKEYIMEDAAPKILLTQEKYLAGLAYYTGPLFAIDTQLDSLKNGEGELSGPAARDLAYIIYTSGTTGKPKGVMLEHGTVVNTILAQQSAFAAEMGDRHLQFASVSFDASVSEIFVSLASCGVLYIVEDSIKKDPALLESYIRSEGVGIATIPPSYLKQMDIEGLKEMKSLITAGEAADPASAVSFAQFGLYHNAYGPTENSICATIYSVSKGDNIGPVVPIGRPLVNMRVYILDRYGKLCPTSVTGEICVAGAGVARGYLNRPELTSERFLVDPFVPGERMYRTGDMGRWLPDGNIEFLGRTDDQVKVRGYRIELGEIEMQLNRLPEVKDAVVLAFGQDISDKKLVAFLLSATADQDTDLVKQHLKDQMPAYMIPSAFVWVEAFPKTMSGKIDRKALAMPVLKRPESTSTPYRSPSTALEKQLATMWSELLQIEHIGVDDNFFELGGHSLAAVKIMHRIANEVGKRLPIALFFQYPTISKLAQILQSDIADLPLSTLVPIKASGSKLPIYLIHGGGLNVLIYQPLGKYLDPEQPLYALQAIGLNGKDEVPPTISEMAKVYLAEILEHNPTGPYALAGYSLGGIIAYEIAKQLLAMGREVAMLGIMDTNADDRDWQLPLGKRLAKKTIRQFKKIGHLLKSYSKYPGETWRYQLRGLKPSAAAEDGMDEDFVADESEIARVYYAAYHQYMLQPLPLKIHLFRVNKRIYYVDDPVYLGWKAYALKGVEICPIPGDHKTFLYAPNDQVFARTLEKTFHETLQQQQAS